jgi:hypothetical protein
MALITPTGAPAWLRTVSIGHYGGHVSKENYLSRGAIDALTDVAAEEFVRMTADLAATVRGAPFAIITYLNNDTSPAAPTVESVLMMTGVRLTSYAGGTPPTGFPAAARQGTGEVTFTFSASYLDEYAVTGVFTPVGAKATGHGSTFVAPVIEIAGSAVTVLCRDNTSAAVGNKRVTLEVW